MKYKFLEEYQPYYKYEANPVVENEDFKIYYDRTIHSQHQQSHNRPDITILDKKSKICTLVDVAVPISNNIQKSYLEKRRKYAELAVEIKRQWNLSRVDILPVIISAEGLVHKDIRRNLLKL